MDWQFTDDRPIWQQLTQQLTLRILKGEYPPGERLPGVRELAAQAGVNPNTMQRAMAQLEADGLAVGRRTSPSLRPPPRNGPGKPSPNASGFCPSWATPEKKLLCL